MNSIRTLMAAALAGGLIAGCKNATPVSADTHEEARPSLFTHEKHDSIDCVDCHTAIPKAQRLGEAKLPAVVKCEECHPDIAKPIDETTRKAAAAAATLERAQTREYQITFSHEAHLKRINKKEANEACATCHKEMPEAAQVRDVTPPMSTCTSCHHHEEDVAQAKCTPCHVSLRRYPLKPIEALAAMSHQGNWVREHRNAAKSGAETCAQCHDQTYCANCHANATVPFRAEIRFPERVESDFIHRGDYVSRHQTEAAFDPGSCRKCHGSFFCNSCHQEQNVARKSLSNNPRDPHPAGWTARDQHGRAARIDIVSCAGCHDQGPASICVSCHRVGGIGGSPHPSGFTSQHNISDVRTNGVCRVCHGNG